MTSRKRETDHTKQLQQYMLFEIHNLGCKVLVFLQQEVFSHLEERRLCCLEIRLGVKNCYSDRMDVNYQAPPITQRVTQRIEIIFKQVKDRGSKE